MRQVQPVPCLAEAEGCLAARRWAGSPMISVRRRRPPRGPGLRRAQRPPDHPPENLRDSLDRNAAYTVAAYLA